jgi:hypothetical protein
MAAFCSAMMRDASEMKCSGFLVNCSKIAGVIWPKTLAVVSRVSCAFSARIMHEGWRA